MADGDGGRRKSDKISDFDLEEPREIRFSAINIKTWKAER